EAGRLLLLLFPDGERGGAERLDRAKRQKTACDAVPHQLVLLKHPLAILLQGEFLCFHHMLHQDVTVLPNDRMFAIEKMPDRPRSAPEAGEEADQADHTRLRVQPPSR